MAGENLSLVSIFPWTLIFTWVNMVILFFALKKILFKPVQNILKKRQEEIDALYSSAEEAADTAKSLEKEYNEKIAVAKDTAGNIIKTATIAAQKREVEIIDKARVDAELITKRAQEEIKQEKKKAYTQIKGDIADISVSIAEKIVEKEINQKDHEALIEKFIEKIGASDE